MGDLELQHGLINYDFMIIWCYLW